MGFFYRLNAGISRGRRASAGCRSYPVALRRPLAGFRDRRELFVATSCRSRRARFTELLSGNARATSGSKRTRFVPAVARW